MTVAQSKALAKRLAPWAGIAMLAWTGANAHFLPRSEYVLDRRTDSLTVYGELRELRRMTSNLDSSDRCSRGQRGFCR